MTIMGRRTITIKALLSPVGTLLFNFTPHKKFGLFGRDSSMIEVEGIISNHMFLKELPPIFPNFQNITGLNKH